MVVQEAGPLTTVQDLGRAGYLRVGVPTSGPMDRESFVVANRLVGNPDGAAALECTLMGPRLELTDARVVAVTGADMPVTLNGAAVEAWTVIAVGAGDVLRLAAARSGVRAYLAVSGGIDTPPALGSRSTYLRGQLGGVEGRAVRKGDRLPLGVAGAVVAAAGRRAHPPRPAEAAGAPAVLRVVLGPQDDRFTAAGIATLLESEYEMTPQSDRMGARFKGPRIEHSRGHDILSDGIALGAVQVVGDGQPIVLLADRQSTGGYTKIATVCSFDIGRLAQVKPGQRVRFALTSVEEAHAIGRAQRAALDAAIERA
jgi:antagonist of KipI